MIFTISRRLSGGLLGLALLAGAAQAQTPPEPDAADPICVGLVRVLAAADEEIPFIILVPANQSLGSLPRLNRNPPGFEDFSSCQLYRAGNAKQGTVGGGPHNYLRCTAFSKMTTDSKPEEGPVAKAAASEAYEKLAARAKACLEPAGWTAGRRTHAQATRTMRPPSFTRRRHGQRCRGPAGGDNSSPGARSRSRPSGVSTSPSAANPNHRSNSRRPIPTARKATGRTLWVQRRPIFK
ncbi:MAG: hypothetical protein R3C46_03030 [Hyphomonadaceae bacterium]